MTAYSNVPGCANLSVNDNMIAKDGMTGKTALGNNQTVTSYLAVMADLNLIIELAPLTDDSIAKRSSVYCVVRADFNVVVNDYAAYAFNSLIASALSSHVFKAVITNRIIRIYSHVVTNYGALFNHCIGVNRYIITNIYSIHDLYPGHEVAMFPNLAMLSYIDVGHQRGVCLVKQSVFFVSCSNEVTDLAYRHRDGRLGS